MNKSEDDIINNNKMKSLTKLSQHCSVRYLVTICNKLYICITRGFDSNGGNVLEMTRVPLALFVFCNVL